MAKCSEPAGESCVIRQTFNRGQVAILGTLIVQIVCVVWWAATISARVGYVEERLFNVDQRVHAMEVE